MSKLMPESRWSVWREDAKLVDVDWNGVRCETDLNRIRKIRISTNDSGPRGVDFWWVFEGLDETVLCAFPQGATGEQAIVDWLKALSGFDDDAMTRAIRSTDNADFIVWRRGP